jgi:predicted Zn-dependent protease
MIRHRILAAILVLGCAAVLASAACSSSGKSGERGKRTVLLSDSDDARVGKEASGAVASQMGLYDNAELESYVSRIGNELLRGVPRKGFRYQFKIVDQFEPNAFALPGGYIFVSRGLLALMNNEDELANVLGHEITHAAKRHAAMQQALTGQGPLAMPWIRAANMAAYGRDMERDADQGGQILAAAAGYDPMGMSTFMASLDQMERLRVGHVRQTTFFDSHPGSPERAAVNAARSHEIRRRSAPELGDTKTSFLRRIDGLPVGPRPEGGVFDGDRFLQPDMDFQLRFPEGWRVSNSNQAVGAVSPKHDAMIYLTADQPEGDPKAVAAAFIVETNKQFPVEVTDSGPVVIGGIDAWRVRLQGGGHGGGIAASVTFIPYRGATYRITGVSSSFGAKTYAGRMLNTTRSFRPLSSEERSKIHETRLHLVTALPGEDLGAIGRRSDNAWEVSTTALYNGVFIDHRYAGGELVKTTRVEPYSPQASGSPMK